MSQKPPLKLKLSAPHTAKQEPQDSPPTATGLKLKFGKKTTSQTPAPLTPSHTATSTTIKPKPARKTKPTPKKRALEEDPDAQSSDAEDDDGVLEAVPTLTSQNKRLKLNNPHAPTKGPKRLLTLVGGKARGEVPVRPRGVGYDSEASDREEDPTITESIILRMAPGPDCDYLREAVTQGNFGKTKDGGADIAIRFISSDGRRVVVTIRRQLYAAILVDLPCIVEAMKSWFPRTGWIKSADICQMLMVLGPIEEEIHALHYPLPVGKGELDEKTWQWAHGLTPPMHWVRKRRFRKRISVRTVMEVEGEVEEMLRKDELCYGEPKIDIIGRTDNSSEDAFGEDDDDDDDDDAEGDDDDDHHHHDEAPIQTIEGKAEDEEAENARMAELFERQMMATTDDAEPSANTQNFTSAGPSFDSPSQLQPLSTPPSLVATPSAVATPIATGAVDTSSAAEEDEEEDSSDEDAGEEDDDDKAERQQEMQKLKEEVEDLEAAIKGEQGKLAGTQNQLLRKRLADKIRGLEGDLELKIKAMEEGG